MLCVGGGVTDVVVLFCLCFSLFGFTGQWYVIDLDFRSVVDQECQEDDFITWVPSGKDHQLLK